MPNLADNYCYPDITSAANSQLGEIYPVSNYLVFNSLVSVSGDTATFIVYAKDATSTAALVTNGTYVRTFPGCVDVGYLTNYTGLSLPDVIEMSFFVVLVWAVAFGFKSMKRTIR